MNEGVILIPLPQSDGRVMGSIGAVSAERHGRLLTSLSEYLMASQVAAS